MKPQKSKQKQSQELSQQIQEFLQSGGSVQHVPSGLSGNINNANIFRSSGQLEPKSSRTPLTEVVKTLEERKMRKKEKPRKTHSAPGKRLIVDDFGEPVRWVWED